MPVDLSKIGLEGQESYATRAYMAAQSKTMEASAEQTALENEHTRKLNDLSAKAQARLQSILNREPQPGVDPEEAAAQMDSLADPLIMVGEVFAAGGAMEEAQKMFSEASTIRKQEADIEDGKVTRQQGQLENIVKGADVVSRWLGSAQNESEWNLGLRNVEKALNDGVFVMDPELFEQIRNMPYDPDVAAYFNEQAISASDKANQELRQITNDRLERGQALTEKYRDKSLRLSEERLAEQKRYNRRLEKVSGKKPVGAPTSDQLKSVRDIFGKDGVDTASDGYRSSVQYVASQALQIVRDNPAINWETAVRQSILRAKQSGAITIRDSFGKDDVEFDSGKLPESAIPIPAKADGTPDRAKMKKGNWYITSQGRARWDGKQFVME